MWIANCDFDKSDCGERREWGRETRKGHRRSKETERRRHFRERRELKLGDEIEIE